jgi:hypothetical protein
VLGGGLPCAGDLLSSSAFELGFPPGRLLLPRGISLEPEACVGVRAVRAWKTAAHSPRREIAGSTRTALMAGPNIADIAVPPRKITTNPKAAGS